MKMKKFTGLLLSAGLVMLNTTAVLADGKSNQTVTFDGTNMTSSFDGDSIDKVIADMQPGDTVEYDIALVNSHSDVTDWWMRNDVLQTFEEMQKDPSFGAYTYILTYSGPKGETVIFDSNSVGGTDEDDIAGLEEVDDALENYFYLDALGAGQTGHVHLTVTLDGPTLRNAYFNTFARLEFQFGVEVNHVDPIIIEHHYRLPYTGDRNNMMPYMILLGISGLVILGIAIYRYKKETGEGA